ncbi:MAG: FG-GAP repeat protein [Thermoanaerobaculia bacterium]
MGGFFWEAAPGSPTPAHAGDVYGRALGAGDFNDDGLADLVIGAPGNLFLDETGDVRIHYGLPGGIQGLPEHVLRPGVAGVPATGLHATNRNAKFGASFAVGDFDGDGHADLAIGAPDWSFATGELKAGSVVVAHGDIGGLMPFAATRSPNAKRGFRITPRAAISSAPLSPPATSTATASTTWRSAPPPRTVSVRCSSCSAARTA